MNQREENITNANPWNNAQQNAKNNKNQQGSWSNPTGIRKEGGYNNDAFQIIAEAGFMASFMGLFEEAKIIFNGMHGMKEQSAYPIIGKAFSLITDGKAQEAAKLLETSALALEPQNNEVKCFLALAFHLAKKPADKERVLNSIQKPSDQVSEFMKVLYDNS